MDEASEARGGVGQRPTRDEDTHEVGAGRFTDDAVQIVDFSGRV